MSQEAFSALLFLLLVGGSGCSRTPPEPAPASTTNSTAIAADRTGPKNAPAASMTVTNAGTTPIGGGRCVTASPAEAPPIPAPASAAACPRDPEGIPKSQVAQVLFPEAAGSPKVDVELAKSEHDIQRGLMYRRTMAEDHGMLFHLDERREHTFWMHNTCMSLDMLFIDEDGTVVGIVEGATPLTDTSRTVGCSSVFVLEVNAGWCRRHGVRAGQKLSLPASAR